MTPESENWGGTRKGAGRPKSAVVRLKDVTIPREVWELLEQQAQRQGVSTAELTASVLEAHATAPLFGIMQK